MYKLDEIVVEYPASRDGRAIDKAFLLDKVRAYAAHYRHLPKRSKVILWHGDSLEFATRLLALGQFDVDVILPPNCQAQTLRDLANLSPFYSGEVLEDLPSEMVLIDEYSDEHTHPEQLYWPCAEVGAGELVFFTSGSTGPAKAIGKTWRAINTELATLESTFTTNAEAEFVAMVSHQHIYGLLFKLLWPLRYGHRFEVTTYQYPEHLAKRVSGYNTWFMVASPAQLSRLTQDNVLIPVRERISKVFSSGGPLKDDDAMTLFAQLELGVTQVYGSTETGGIGYRDVVSKELTPWQPFSGVSVSQGVTSLLLCSPLIEEPQRALDDTGKVLSDGCFVLTGRADRTVKVAEKRVNLAGMEQRLNAHENVANCVIVQLQSGRLGALVELTHDANSATTNKETSSALKQWLSLEFEAVCIPRKWRYVSELPYNSQGKLVYSELEQYFV
ncbi:AMP-binding protein [Pseudoalteromonas sp. YIC-656]|uniref:AMP-binding protein n=1 Tax=Pseudoalteromonas pernae TaxID=3118054 RepID=UPI003242A9A0